MTLMTLLCVTMVGEQGCVAMLSYSHSPCPCPCQRLVISAPPAAAQIKCGPVRVWVLGDSISFRLFRVRTTSHPMVALESVVAGVRVRVQVQVQVLSIEMI